MENTHIDEDEWVTLDEMTGSKSKTEFIVTQEVRVSPDLSDDDIMEILNYALRINK
jgi:hypothetical protein